MALFHSPRVVTDGLILYLDAANTKSYPGSGTTWFDLSPSKTNFTLVNTPTFSNGAFTFNGTNQYANSASAINFSALNNITVEIWADSTTLSPGMILEHTADWNTVTGGWGVASNSNGAATTDNTMHTNHNTEVARNYTYTRLQTWNNHVNIFSRVSDSTGRLAYVNGQLATFVSPYGTDSVTSAGGSFPNATMYLASRGGASVWFAGRISSIKIYNKKLTAAEILQNFNAHRGRFGV